MMLNLFPKVKCKNCSKKIKRKDAYELQYRSADGIGTIKICSDCAQILENIKKEVDDLYGDNSV